MKLARAQVENSGDRLFHRETHFLPPGHRGTFALLHRGQNIPSRCCAREGTVTTLPEQQRTAGKTGWGREMAQQFLWPHSVSQDRCPVCEGLRLIWVIITRSQVWPQQTQALRNTAVEPRNLLILAQFHQLLFVQFILIKWYFEDSKWYFEDSNQLPRLSFMPPYLEVHPSVFSSIQERYSLVPQSCLLRTMLSCVQCRLVASLKSCLGSLFSNHHFLT